MGYKHPQKHVRSVPEPLGKNHVQGLLRSEPSQAPVSLEPIIHCPAMNDPVLAMRCRNFVAVGLTLGTIRDQRLYRAEFRTFEAYCREKWRYGRSRVHQLIVAARLYSHLSSTCVAWKPDHESQLRPLAGLSLEQAQLAWESAPKEAGGRSITAGHVKGAVKQLGLAPAGPPVSKISGRKKAEERRHLAQAIGQLLVLAREKASYDLLTQQIDTDRVPSLAHSIHVPATGQSALVKEAKEQT